MRRDVSLYPMFATRTRMSYEFVCGAKNGISTRRIRTDRSVFAMTDPTRTPIFTMSLFFKIFILPVSPGRRTNPGSATPRLIIRRRYLRLLRVPSYLTFNRYCAISSGFVDPTSPYIYSAYVLLTTFSIFSTRHSYIKKKTNNILRNFLRSCFWTCLRA